MTWNAIFIIFSVWIVTPTHQFVSQTGSTPSIANNFRPSLACIHSSLPAAMAPLNCTATASTRDLCWRHSLPTWGGLWCCCTRSFRCRWDKSGCPWDKAGIPSDTRWSHAIVQHSGWFCFCKASLMRICGSAWRFLDAWNEKFKGKLSKSSIGGFSIASH